MSAPQMPQQPAVVYVARPTDGFCVASFVLALLGFNIVAVILGHIGLRRTKQSGAGGTGFAVAGLIIGYLTLIAIIIGLVLTGLAVFWGISVSQA